MSSVSKTVSHAGIYAISNIVRYSASFVLLPIYTRYLTASDYGVIELLQTIIDLAGIIFGMRIAEAIYRDYAQQDTQTGRSRIISTAMSMHGITFGVGALGIAVLAEPLGQLVFGSPAYAGYIRAFAAVFFLQAIAEIPLLLIRAQQRPWVFVGFSLLKLSMQVGFNLYFVVHRELHVEGAIDSTLWSSGLFMAMLLAYTASTSGIVRPDVAIARRLIGFSFPLMLADIGSFYLTFGDRYFLRIFSGLSEIGIYALGYKFGFMLAYLVWTPFSSAWDARKYHIQKEPDARGVFQRTFLMASFILILAGLGMSLFAENVLHVMSAPEFWPAAKIVPVIILAYIAQMWTFYCSFGVYLSGKTIHITYGSLFASVIITIAYFALIPAYGGMGAAAATLFAFIARLYWVERAASREYDMELPWRKALAMVGVAIAIYLASRLWVPEHWMLSLLWKSLLWVIYVGLFLVLPVFSDRQKQVFRTLLRNPLKVAEIIR